jgi:pimeloyl-ACP methyl ester carboxylesterase
MRALLAGIAALTFASLALASEPSVTSSDLFVPYTSKLPANAGQIVGLHVRHISQTPAPARVVLFVHGGTVPAVPAFGLRYKDYDWLSFMARNGYDVFAMDMTGYGSSPRPRMDDPCNVSEKQRLILKDNPLKQDCSAHFSSELTTNSNEWAEIDAVVDYLLKMTGVSKLDIVGWSAGGVRVGGYISLHPEKIARAVLYAPSPPTPGLRVPDQPGSGVPTALQTRPDFEKVRWDPDLRCEGQLEPGLRDELWKQIMQWDSVGRSWGTPDEGVMRGPTITGYGWPDEMASKISVPTMVIYGEFDIPDKRKRTYDLIAGTADKLSVRVACASHFMLWEKQHRILQQASFDWLTKGAVSGNSKGEISVNPDGQYTR